MNKSNNYLEYHKELSVIEECLILKKYTEALNLFSNLISQYQFIFPRDAYLATQIAAYLNEKELAKVFLIKAIESGCDFKMLKKNLHIKKIINDIGIKEFKEIYSKSNLEYKKNISTEVKETLQKLHKKDREYLISYYKLYNFFSKEKILHEWNEYSVTAGAEVKEIIQNVGFPSYKIVGTDNLEDYKKGDFKDYISSHMAIILLAHDYESIKDVMPLLLEEVNKGHMSARALAFLRDVITFKRLTKKKLKNDDFDTYKYGTFLFQDENIENISDYNYERKEIGLCSLETEKEKHLINNLYTKSVFWNRRNKNFNKPVFHFLTEDIC